MFEISPETAFKFVKYCVTFTCTWPPNKNASKKDVIIFQMKWWILWFNSTLFSVASIYTLHSYRRDIFRFTECLLFTQLLMQTNVKMCFCKSQYNRIQFILEETQCFFRDGSPEYRELFLAYVKKYGVANFAFIFYTFWCTLVVVLGPILSPQPFPIKVNYPFDTDSKPLFQIIYMQHVLGACQVVSGAGIDNQISTMIWCMVIRFQILRKQMSKISNADEFKQPIRSHQYLLWLANETVKVSRYIIFTTVISSILTVILSGVLVVGNQPMMLRLTSIWLFFARCVLLYLLALPSEHLLESCEGISSAIYDCEWIDNDYKKNIAFVIFRSRKPAIISVAGFLPQLSLNYYAMFLSKSFSFFTTLRIVLAKIESDTPE